MGSPAANVPVPEDASSTSMGALERRTVATESEDEPRRHQQDEDKEGPSCQIDGIGKGPLTEQRTKGCNHDGSQGPARHEHLLSSPNAPADGVARSRPAGDVRRSEFKMRARDPMAREPSRNAAL